MLSQHEEDVLKHLVQSQTPLRVTNPQPASRSTVSIDSFVNNLVARERAKGPLCRVVGPTREEVIDHNYRTGGFVTARTTPVAITE